MAKTKRNKKDEKMSKKLDAKFSEVYGERFGNEKITQVNAADADLEYSQIFGANKNLARITPSLISGLKPGKTRCYYNWWEMEGRPQNTKSDTLKKLEFYKVDELASTTVKYHPHGTASMQEMLGKDGQYWNNNVMMLVPQGAYGNLRGDSVASGRYIEAKLSEYVIDCFFDDFDSYCVPMKPSYTGKSMEPEYLPAKYPHILFNPQFSGIGYGMAANIPGFNVSEVLDATIKLIKDPEAKIMLIPDSPTGCDILDEGHFKEINKSGQQCKITMRATAEINYVDNIIHISSLPYISTSGGVISKIIELKKTKNTFSEIVEIRDYTIEGEVSIDIFLKDDAKPEKVLKQLYKRNVGLKSTFPVGIVVVDNYEIKEYGIKDLLLAWIEYRLDAVRSMMLNKYQMMLSKEHMNSVLLMVFSKDNIDTTIKIARTSKSRKETIERFMKTFKITSLQAGVIADMKVHQFNSDSYNKFKDDEIKIKEEIKEINGILTDDNKLEEFVIHQLEEGKKKYGRPRKSKVVKENDKSNDNIPDTEHLVGISESGFIKKLLLKNTTSIGKVGNTNSKLTVLQVNNRENLLIVDSNGYVTKISISAIPDMEFEDEGVELRKFFSTKGDVKAVMELPSMDILKVKNDNFGIIFITKRGLAKKVLLSEFKKLTDTKCAMVLNKDDEVASAFFDITTGKETKDIVFCTDNGNGVRLPTTEIPTNGVTAKGMAMVSLSEDENLVSASIINLKKKFIFLLTSSGRGKLIESKYFPVMNRKEKPLKLIDINSNEHMVGITAVNKSDSIMIYRKKGSSEVIKVSDLTIDTRASKGSKIITPGRGDSIVAYTVFTEK